MIHILLHTHLISCVNRDNMISYVHMISYVYTMISYV